MFFVKIDPSNYNDETVILYVHGSIKNIQRVSVFIHLFYFNNVHFSLCMNPRKIMLFMLRL